MQPEASIDHQSPEDLRGHRRVDVRLRVAMRLNRETACIARTRNISEGGMLLCEYSGPQLDAGRLVGINLRGVLSDGDDGEAEGEPYLMRVVRQRGDAVALRFT